MAEEKAPVENKVYAASDGAGAGGVLVTLILWVVGVVFYRVAPTAEAAPLATAAVAGPVALALSFFLPKGLAMLMGYLAPHTHRPDLKTLDTKPAEVEEFPTFTANNPSIPPSNPDDLDGDGRDDKTQRFVKRSSALEEPTE